MGTYLSIPMVSRKVVHLEPAKQEVTYEDGIVVLGSSIIEKMPMTPIHEEENLCEAIPAEEVKPVEEAKSVEEAKPVEETKSVEEVKPVEEAKSAEPITDKVSKLTIQIPEESTVKPEPVKPEPVKPEPIRRSNRRQRKHN